MSEKAADAPSRCSTCGGELGDTRRVPGGGLRVVQRLSVGKDGKVRCGACERNHAATPPLKDAEVHPGAEPAANDETPAPARPPCKSCHGTARDFSKGGVGDDCDTCKGTGRQP